MSGIQGQAIFMAGGIVVFLALCSALTVFNWALAARGQLDRNAFVGIRLPNSARSQAAWAAAHRVGLRSAPLYAVFNLGMCAALFEPARRGSRLATAFIGGGGLFALIPLICCTLYCANKAALAVDVNTDHPARPSALAAQLSPSSRRPTPPLSARTKAILTWITAVAACMGVLLLLGNIVDGYVLAQHQRLVPADNFGFRDAATTACWARWYPSQKAGFQWFLCSYGPILIGGIAIIIGAAIKKRSPMDIWALVLAMVMGMLPFLFLAAKHAGDVARSITC
jgi:hypothetical protein